MNMSMQMLGGDKKLISAPPENPKHKRPNDFNSSGPWPRVYSETVLLAVDDDLRVLKTIERLMSKSFDKILTAENALLAEWLLKNTSITHLVVDYDLGENDPNGFKLITKWRTQYPQIGKGIIFTGQEGLTNRAPDYVDLVVNKSADVEVLRAALGMTNEKSEHKPNRMED